MVRNAAIALLVIISAALAYGYYQTAKEAAEALAKERAAPAVSQPKPAG